MSQAFERIIRGLEAEGRVTSEQVARWRTAPFWRRVWAIFAGAVMTAPKLPRLYLEACRTVQEREQRARRRQHIRDVLERREIRREVQQQRCRERLRRQP